MIDVLTLNFNDASTTIQFVDSLKNYECISHILVVDNGSTDNSLECLKKIESDKIVVISSEKNGGYGTGNNFGIRYLYENLKSKYILLANPDTTIEENSINALQNFLMLNPKYAVVAPFMVDGKMERQHNTAFRIPRKAEYIASLEILSSKMSKSFYYTGVTKERSGVKDVGAVSGSLFMMDADKMIKYGMFDERMFLYCEELVLGMKLAKNNQKLALLLEHTFVHNHSVSIDKTFGKSLMKHKLFLNSKLFVIKNYFNANYFEYALAWLLSRISLFEVRLIYFMRRFR